MHDASLAFEGAAGESKPTPSGKLLLEFTSEEPNLQKQSVAAFVIVCPLKNMASSDPRQRHAHHANVCVLASGIVENLNGIALETLNARLWYSV